MGGGPPIGETRTKAVRDAGLSLIKKARLCCGRECPNSMIGPRGSRCPGRFRKPRFINDRMVVGRATDVPRIRRHPRSDFIKRRSDEAGVTRVHPDARKDLVRPQNPATRIIVRLAVDRPDRQAAALLKRHRFALALRQGRGGPQRPASLQRGVFSS